ncbi:MAG: hypothetical protein QM808_00395 [Steroidobacteraceae bacterium]
MFRRLFGRDTAQWLPIARAGDKSARIELGGGSGLCSQIVNVFLAAMYAEAHGYQAYLDESVALMRHRTWPSFWKRYFMPVGVDRPLPDPINLFFTPPTLEFSNQPTINIPSLSLVGDALTVKQTLYNRYIRLQPAVAATINKRIRRLKLEDGYISCKFRRGDKYIAEAHPPVGLDQYLEALDPLMSDGTCLYAASDDYRCVDELREARPHWNIKSQPSKPTGFQSHEVKTWKPKYLHEHVMDALTEIQIMADSRIHVGLLGSNVCHVVAYMRLGKDNSTFISLDYPFPQAVN